MGLHDRIKGGTNGNGNGNGNGGEPHVSLASVAPQAPDTPHLDPYAELKTRIHHACIAKLGPQLFGSDSTSDLSDSVLRTVTEQLALDRTPLTREERRRITREIADDILGYGPLEPFLRDDTVTEVMVNSSEQIYIER